MKKLFTIIILLSMVFNLSAQTRTKKVNVTFGDELKVKKKTTLGDIIGKDDSGLYALKIKRKLFGHSDITLEHFNNRMQLTKSVPLELLHSEKKRVYEGILNIDNRLILFTSFINQKKKKKYLFKQSIDKKTLTLNNDLKKIAEIDFTTKSNNNSGSFSNVVSRDSSKVLVYYNLPYSKGEPERFGLQVYDTKMDLLWEKEIKLPYEDKLFGIEEYQIDKSGDVYILGTLYK